MDSTRKNQGQKSQSKSSKDTALAVLKLAVKDLADKDQEIRSDAIKFFMTDGGLVAFCEACGVDATELTSAALLTVREDLGVRRDTAVRSVIRRLLSA